MVRNMRAVLKKASWGTRRIFRGIRCKKQAFSVRKGYSVHKTGSCGTRRIFKGPQNSTCYIERIFKGPQNSRLHRLWTASSGTRCVFRGPRCMKPPPAAPDAFSVRETAPALFVRSGPFHHFLRPANAELVSGGPFPCSFDGTRYQKQPPLGGEQTQKKCAPKGTHLY